MNLYDDWYVNLKVDLKSIDDRLTADMTLEFGYLKKLNKMKTG